MTLEMGTRLKNAKEDILRAIIELQTNEVNIIQSELDTPEVFTQAVNELKKRELVHITNNTIILTCAGEKAAQSIVTRHKAIEEYFKLELDEEQAHRIAHTLEHIISQEVVKTLKEIREFRDKGEALTKHHSGEGLITCLDLADSYLFDRMISMGICPGQWLRIIMNIPSGIIILIGNTLLAVGQEIAQRIQVMFS